VDKNGNGIIDTSTGKADIVDNDECILWRKELNKNSGVECRTIKAVVSTTEKGENSELTGNVWIGCTFSKMAYKLSGIDGSVLESREINTDAIRGFVLDEKGRIWFPNRLGLHGDSVELVWFDSSEVSSVHRIALPDVDKKSLGEIHIALDNNGDIWLSARNHILRYKTESKEWGSLTIDSISYIGSITIDNSGYIWFAQGGFETSLYYVDIKKFPDKNSLSKPFTTAKNDSSSRSSGIAVDFSNNILAVYTTNNQGSYKGRVEKYEIDRQSETPVVDISNNKTVEIGSYPNAYSDLIGYNLRNMASTTGWIRQRFGVCKNYDFTSRWNKIYWDIETPPGTSVVLRARTANKSVEALEEAEFITIAKIPEDTGNEKEIPITLPKGFYIEIEAHLSSETSGITPTVGAINFNYECMQIQDE